MENIKFGDIEYFELLTFQDKLKNSRLNLLGLDSLDKLRMEVHIKVERIHYEDKEYRKPDSVKAVEAKGKGAK